MLNRNTKIKITIDITMSLVLLLNLGWTGLADTSCWAWRSWLSIPCFIFSGLPV